MLTIAVTAVGSSWISLIQCSKFFDEDDDSRSDYMSRVYYISRYHGTLCRVGLNMVELLCLSLGHSGCKEFIFHYRLSFESSIAQLDKCV